MVYGDYQNYHVLNQTLEMISLYYSEEIEMQIPMLTYTYNNQRQIFIESNIKVQL